MQTKQIGGVKMKKRRVLAGMMALTMALSLAGCGGGSSLKLRIEIRHLFEVQQLLCTYAAYTGNAYWVFKPLGLPAQKG